MEGLRAESLLMFVSAPPNLNPAAPPPLHLARILDMAPITITDQTPMETVIDMFRKLGLRQTLVTHNGYGSIQFLQINTKGAVGC